MLKVPDEIKTCLEAVNPYFKTHKTSYMENCQRCVAAYELRRRGHTVIARPTPSLGTDPLPYMDLRNGWPAIFKGSRLISCVAITQEQAKNNVEKIMYQFGYGSRCIVRLNWIHKNYGHVFIAENINQTIWFVDPQTGSENVAWYFQYAVPASVYVIRIDTAEISELVKYCCELVHYG